MNSNETSIESLFEKAEECSKVTIELMKLKVIDRSADVVSSIAIKMAFFIVVTMFIVIINIGIALWLGELLGKPYFGFFVVAGIYALIGILLRSFINQWIKIPVSNFVINLMLNSKAV